jgi:hypothetical protein
MCPPIQRIGVELHVEAERLAIEAPALRIGSVDREPTRSLTNYSNLYKKN